MDSILQDIIHCEEEALRLEEQAKKQSLEILAEARKKADEILENSLVEGETMTEEMLQKAREDAIVERNHQENSQVKVDDQIRTNSREKINAATDFIVRRVVNKSWQS